MIYIYIYICYRNMETTTQKNKMTCPYIFGDTYYITNISILYNYNITPKKNETHASPLAPPVELGLHPQKTQLDSARSGGTLLWSSPRSEEHMVGTHDKPRCSPSLPAPNCSCLGPIKSPGCL